LHIIAAIEGGKTEKRGKGYLFPPGDGGRKRESFYSNAAKTQKEKNF